jgi:hypothetical protein
MAAVVQSLERGRERGIICIAAVRMRRDEGRV